MGIKALKINNTDNVAVVTRAVIKNDEVDVEGNTIIVTEDIPAGHKIALTDIAKGENIIKYGIPIGRAKTDITTGEWVHCHNVEDITEELCDKYCNEFGGKNHTIEAFVRKNGSFGVANYIYIISTSLSANKIARQISDATDVFWFVCDSEQLLDGKLSELTQRAISKTAENPNVYGAIVLYDESLPEYATLADKAENFVAYSIKDGEQVIESAIDTVEKWQKEIVGLSRQRVPASGLTISVHCAGSDWTTALSGNPAVGIAADLLVKDGGYVFMDEWAGFPGSEHLLAGHAADNKTALELINKVREVRSDFIKRTGKTVEEVNPYPSNKEGGITTLVEKSTGNIKKAGGAVLQKILSPGEKPTVPGLYILDQRCGAPASTGAYGALSGAHINVQVSGVGYIYDEVSPLIDIRVTGNSESFMHKEFKLDFNAGIALEDYSLEETGTKLYEYILDVASGRKQTVNEATKEKSYTFPYENSTHFGEEYILVDTYKLMHEKKVNEISG